jgi:DNA polymerase-3 subunit alpha
MLYIPLRIHSPYSISEGAARPQHLTDFAVQHKIPAIGVADRKSLGGAFTLKDACKKKGIQPLHGVLVNVEHPDISGDNIEHSELVLYAKSEKGYTQICTLLSTALTGNGNLTLKDFIQHQYSGEYFVLTGGKKGPIDKALFEADEDKVKKRLKSFVKLFGDRLWVEIQRQTEDDVEHTQKLAKIAKDMGVPVIATHQAWYIAPEFKEAHDALLCISQNMTLDHYDRIHTDPAGHLLTPEDMTDLFSDIPEALKATVDFAQMCHWFIEEVEPSLPAFPGLEISEAEELREQSKKGLEKRLLKITFVDGKTEHGYTRENYLKRLDYELSVIESMGFPGYFLIVADFIKWSKDNDIPVGPGRGSGAGSIVAWALTITDLDPLRYGLYFERFLNPERVSMPDFDIDFCQERRDEVISYVREHYGQDRVAQIGTLGKLQARAVVRAAGRVMQIPYPVVDRFVKLIPNNPAHPLTLGEAMETEPLATQIAESDDTIQRMFKIGISLEGLFAHTSTHAAGVVIGNKPVGEIVPVYKDSHDITVTGYDMKGVEKAGLVKFDFLGLKTLDVIKGTLEMIKNQGTDIDFDIIGTEDPKTYEMLCKGDAFGVFQLESAGMRRAMLQIQPTCIEDIIALVALYRPGPMDSIPVYANVKSGDMDPGYLHPLMEETLSETHGIIVYQEQVMKLAQDMAGYSLGGADLLRRAMGKKIKAEMDAQESVFLKGAIKNGIEESVAKDTFDLIAKFANYGFNKSHAAAYAVIAFQTAYLRKHHKEAFLASTMNLDLHDVEKIAEALEDARRYDVHHRSPNINLSQSKFSLIEEGNKTIIVHGLSALRGVGGSMAQAIIEERTKSGPYTSIYDLTQRCAGTINKKALESLISSGALDVFTNNRAALTKVVPDALKDAAREKGDAAKGQASLFDMFSVDTTTFDHKLPDVPDWDEQKRLVKQYDVVGFFLDGHPLDELRTQINRRRGSWKISQLLKSEPEDFIPRDIVIGAYILDSTFRKTKNGDPMIILRICDETALIEALAFKEAVEIIQTKLPKPNGARVLLSVGPSGTGDDLSLFIRDIEVLDM